MIMYDQAFDLNDAADKEFNADYSILAVTEIQKSNFNENSTIVEIEVDREIMPKDDPGKKETLNILERSSSDKEESEVNINQTFEEEQQFVRDMNVDAGVTAPEGALLDLANSCKFCFLLSINFLFEYVC